MSPKRQKRINTFLTVLLIVGFPCTFQSGVETLTAAKRYSAINTNQFFSSHRLTQEEGSDGNVDPLDEIEQQLEDNSTVTDDTATDYEKVLRNFRYFNQGFKGDEISANFSNCANIGAYWKWVELETYLVKLRFGNGDENVFNTTMWLQNTTNMLSTCTDATQNIYYFVMWKKTQFPTWLDFGLGFLQNLLANVMRLNTVNKRLKELKEDEKDVELYYIGVIVRMLLVFDPVADELSRVNPNDTELINSLFVDTPSAKIRKPLKQQIDIEGHDDRTGLQAFLTPVGILDFFEGSVQGTGLITDMT